MSKLSSVKMESIEFAKRHFNGSSNDFVDDPDDDDDEIHEYEDGESSADHDKALIEIGSSNKFAKSDLSFEEDLACFPNS